ncbi:Retrotransposon gag domain [Sesbania bispinosa]|nr:Retrotransposon gag domain [Sesbania bispinosa]
MEENNLEGRNLSTEMDSMQGKISEMTEAQNRIEETLWAKKEAFGMLGVNATLGGGPSHSAQLVNNAGGEANPDPAQQLLRFVIPVGEGYQAIENPQMDSHGNIGPTWEQPHMFISGQQTGFRAGNSQASIQKEAKEVCMEKMEEKIKAIQGPSTYGSLGIEELFPTMNVSIPRDFKVPEFAKYDGSTNPFLHLKTYCTKMAVWSKDERFLISFFHESLTGPALEWCIQLDHSKISTWKDLADMFMSQYQFNLDTAPTREQLGMLQKKNEETFKQYAQRWRALVAQVQPPLKLSEMCSYFVGTLGSPYVGSMAGATYRDFADLIAAGKRIEILARAGKLSTDYTKSRKGPQSKKRESEVNLIQPQPPVMPQHSQSNPRYPTPSYNPNPCFPYPAPMSPYIPNTNTSSPSPFQINNIHMPRPPTRPNYTYPQSRPYNPQPQSNFQNQGRFRPQNLPPFPKLSISNADLFQRLFDAHLISENPPAGDWIFKKKKGPNIVHNPIPNHERENQANAVEKEEVLIKKVISLRTPMGQIFEGLKKAGYNETIPSTLMKDEGMYDEESSCAYHDGAVGHDIENCWDFKVRVQGLITMGVIQATRKTPFAKKLM